MARFITFEGIDGSGKTTVAKGIYEKLKSRNKDVVLTGEPTKTWIGDAVKRSYAEDVSPFTEALLFLADRANHTLRIRKWLQEGRIVLCDRYCDSTYAYQAASLEEVTQNAMEWLENLSAPFTLEPDLTILLLIEPSLGLDRIKNRSRKTRFEEVDFLSKVQRNYLKLARKKRFVKVDASKAISEVIKEVIKILDLRL